MNSSQCRELDRFTTLQILAEIQNIMTEIQCEPEQFPRRIIFMSMDTDMVLGEFQNRSRLCKKIRVRTLVVSWAWIREEMVRNTHIQTEWRMRSSRWGHDAQFQWKRTSRIPWIQCFGTRRFWKAKKIWKLSIHFCGDDEAAKVVLRTIISVNQLSVCGAVADMCDELACRISGCSESTGKPVAQNSEREHGIHKDVTEMTILQYFVKKTEQSNSDSWHRCFVQNLRLLSVGQFEHGWITSKEEEVLRRDFSIEWIHTLLIPSCTFDHFKAFLEENTLTQHCQTTCCYRGTSSSTSTTLEAPTIRTRSFNLDWFQVAKTSRKGDMRCSLRPWILFPFTYTSKGVTTWRSPRLQCTNTSGKCTKTKCIGVICGVLRARDCSSVKHDPTRSSFTTLYLRCASKRWWSGIQEKNCTAKRISLLLYRKELSWTCIMDAKTLQVETREPPSTILASKKKIVTVERTRKLVAVK